MFDIITKKSHDYLQAQIDELAKRCDEDAGVKEMVRYILIYSDEMAYCSNGNEDANIGREIIQMLYQICGSDFSNMANEYHFTPGWAAGLNSFIGNYINDDFAFDFTQSEFSGVFEFKAADYEGRWLQNAMIIVEAAKANRAYYSTLDNDNTSTGRLARRLQCKVDGSKVFELVK